MRIPLNPRQIRIWLAGLFLICFLYFPPRAFNWAENARLDLTLALVNQGTIAIDAYRQNTGDIALYGGHIYSNKAPGLSLLAVPVYAIHKALFEPFHGAPSFDTVGLPTPSSQLDSYTDMLLYLETIYTVAIPSVLFLLLFFWFLGYFSASLGNRLLLTLALGLGTMVFPYSRVFYAHVPTAGLLFTGFALVYIAARPDSGRGVWSNSLAGHPQGTAALAGLALGAAVLFEYPAALGSLLITAYAALCLSRRQLLFLLAGSALPLLTLMGYHLAAYHNPFSAGYGAYTVNWRQETEGFHGLTWPPRLAAVEGMSFSTYRGLFFVSPFLLLALPGYVLWARRGGWEWLPCVLFPVMLFFAIAMYPYWYCCVVVGPRYLIPMLPFLALPVIFTLDYLTAWPGRLLAYALMALSAFNVWTETLGGTAAGYPGPSLQDPLFQYSLPSLLHGQLPPSLGSLLLGPFAGTRAVVTLAPFGALLLLWSSAALRGWLAALAALSRGTDIESAVRSD